ITTLQTLAQTFDCSKTLNETRTNFTKALQETNRTFLCESPVQGLASMAVNKCFEDVTFRLYFLEFNQQIIEKNCTNNLEDEVYPNESDNCKAASKKCLRSYVDRMAPIYMNSNQRMLFCQYLSDYIDCLQILKECTVNITQLRQIKTYEERRMTSAVPCVIPKLSSTLTTDECDQVLGQCLAPLEEDQSQMTCPKVRVALNCTVGATCATDVMLAIRQVDAVNRLNGSVCEVNDLFHVVCRTCLLTYAENVFSLNETDAILHCRLLDNFAKCLLSDCSMERQKVIDKTSDEIKRLNVTQCNLTSLNSAGRKSVQDFAIIAFTVLVATVTKTIMSRVQ
ncbi:hypothetical protein BgiBS90_027580, partial [Biomphalaria glabrata]